MINGIGGLIGSLLTYPVPNSNIVSLSSEQQKAVNNSINYIKNSSFT